MLAICSHVIGYLDQFSLSTKVTVSAIGYKHGVSQAFIDPEGSSVVIAALQYGCRYCTGMGREQVQNESEHCSVIVGALLVSLKYCLPSSGLGPNCVSRTHFCGSPNLLFTTFCFFKFVPQNIFHSKKTFPKNIFHEKRNSMISVVLERKFHEFEYTYKRQ